MTQQDDRDRQIAILQDRLARLSEASLHINENLELDAVLQSVLDAARSLTGAVYGLLTTLDESGRVEDFLASGLSPEEAQQIWEIPGGYDILAYINALPGALRVPDFTAHMNAMGLPEFLPPTPMSAHLSVPVRHGGDQVGAIHMAKRSPGEEFSEEDEETLTAFAAQAGLVIANARRRREEQRARAALEALVETSPVGIVVFDARTGAPLSFNLEGVRIVDTLRDAGQRPEDLLQVMTVRRADGREVSLMEWPLAEVLRAGDTVRAEEIRLGVPDGRSITVLLNATPVRTEGNAIEWFVIIMQDMTSLEELARLRAEFLGMVSHELRMPLTTIRGSATTMADAVPDLAPAELRQFLRIIVEQADNMRELIDNLLDVARIGTGSLSVNLEPAEVAPLVDRARTIFQGRGSRHVLEIRLAQDLPFVMADKGRIVQVIGNLLSNAARHSPESAVIKMGAVRDGGDVAFYVADEGRGIPSEQMPNLFRKFSDSGTKGDTGLGLAICKGIVEAHGGRIRAESQGPSLGARFTFTIPGVDQPVSETGLEPVNPEPQGERVPILVVDDDPRTLRHVRNALTEAGYHPIVTTDPEEALRLMAEDRPRLVLLDVMLPGYDGIDLMRSLFGIADVPMVFLSAYGRDDIVARALDMGASDYIVKPFSPTELTARVRAALRRREEPYRAESIAPFTLADMTIDYDTRHVYLDGRLLQLTVKEYALLRALSLNAGRVLTHDQLLRMIWGPGRRGNIQSLRTHLRRLRVKLDENGRKATYIFAESGVGYRMPKPDSPEPQEG